MHRHCFLLPFSSLWGISVLIQLNHTSATVRKLSNSDVSCRTSPRVVTVERNEETLEYRARLDDSTSEATYGKNQSVTSTWEMRECPCAHNQWNSNNHYYCPTESTSCVVLPHEVTCLAMAESSQMLRSVWPVFLIFSFPVMVAALLFTYKTSLAIRYIRSWNSPSNDEEQVEEFIQHPELLHQRPWNSLLEQQQLRNARAPPGTHDRRTRRVGSELRIQSPLVLKRTIFHAVVDRQKEELDDTSVVTMSEDGNGEHHHHHQDVASSDREPSDDADDIVANNTPCCAICIAELKEGDKIADIACPHLFHVACIKPWCERKNSCPLCGVRVATSASIANTSPHSRISSSNPVEGDIESGRNATTTT